MRDILKSRECTYDTYTGNYQKIVKHRNYYNKIGKSVLITNIIDKNGIFISDHMWIRYKKIFLKLNLKKDDLIQFRAKSISYLKRNNLSGNIDELDYKLTDIRDIKLLKNGVYKS